MLTEIERINQLEQLIRDLKASQKLLESHTAIARSLESLAKDRAKAEESLRGAKSRGTEQMRPYLEAICELVHDKETTISRLEQECTKEYNAGVDEMIANLQAARLPNRG